MTQFNFEAIGTQWRIDIFKDLNETEQADLLSRIKRRIDQFDVAYSRFRDDSLVTRMSRNKGIFTLPDDAKPMMDLYSDLYKKTNGLVTPLVGNLISDAGYDATYSLKQQGKLEAPPEWEEVIEYHPPQITMKKPVLLDFGAAGKGYLVDIVGGVLDELGIHAYLIDAGGDILHKNVTAIRVGLEDPDNAKQVIGVCNLKNVSICGSAGNRRKWGDFIHIINPQTLVSPKDIAAVWVVSKTALIADGLATCLFFVPAANLREAYEFEYLIVRSDRSLEKSGSFPGELFAG